MKQSNLRAHINTPFSARAERTPSSAAITACHWRPARPRDTARWRTLLLGTAAAGALCLATPRAAEASPDACTINANVATCSGNQSAGIAAGLDFPSPQVDTLNVNNVTQNIGSLPSGDAIRWITLGPINVTSNTGNFIIDSVGPGMFLENQGGGVVTVNHTGDIRTGDAGLIFAIDASSRIANGNAGAVSVTMIGNILGGLGIRAASDGGGGGDGGAVTAVYNGNNAGGLFAFSQGGAAGGNAGTVSVTSNGNLGEGISGLSDTSQGIAGAVSISSTGNLANQIRAQSSGRQGSGSVTVTSTGNISGGLSGIFALSSTSQGATSGAVTVTSTGNMTGVFNGILAASSADAGNSGDITVTSTGNINAAEGTGANGNGIRALSSSDVGNGGNVTVNSSGNITAGTVGIFAGSVGGAPGNIQVTISGGTVRGGGSNAGLEIEGGATNTFAVGSSGVLTSLSGVAIVAGSGNDTVNNSGVITGNVDLGTGTNAFSTSAGGVFNAGTIVNLGAGNAFTNSGTFAPGGAGAAPVTTTLTGNFVQNAGGTYAVDVAGAAADRVNVSGTANLAGGVLATVRSLNLTSSSQQFTILHADGGATNNGITLQGGNTLTSQFQLLFPNLNDMVLQVTTNLTPLGVALTPNQRVTAGHLQSVLNIGGSNLGAVFGHLSGFLDGRAFGAALDRLHPEPYLAAVQSTWLASLNFADGLMSCPTVGNADTNTFIAEGQCAWLRMGARQLDVDRTAENIGFKDKNWGGSGGAQFALTPNWFASFAFGYDNSSIRVDDRAMMSGDLFHAGAGIKYIQGNWEIAGALTGGHASYDTHRFAVIPGVNANSDASLDYFSGRVRLAYVFGSNASYVKPLVDVDVTGMRRRGVRETEAGAAGLNIRSQSDTFVSVAPAVEIGAEYAYGGAVWRPFLRAGARFFSESDLKATASFIGSPDAAPAFTVTTPIDQWMGEAAAGLDLLSADRYDARISYEGRFGERTTQHGGNVKLRAKF